MSTLRFFRRRVAAALRAMMGVPDYDRYVAHMRVAHPNVTPVAREDFWRRCQEDRYSRPGNRCC